MKSTRYGEWLGCALRGLVLGTLLIAGHPLPIAADLKEMSELQMAAITGSGFSRFAIDGNTVRADFNILANTYTEIASLKMGHWDNGSGAGWDQNWTDVQFGTPTQDMSLSGLYIEATFENLADSANRRLTGVFFGFRAVSGDLRANFESLSKIGVSGAQDDPRAVAGTQTFVFNNSELAVSLQLEGDQQGIWVRFGEGTTSTVNP